MRPTACSLILGLLMVLAGCSGSRDADSATGGAATPGIAPESRLDLDGGRVSVFSPQGWRRAPRSYDYLVRYQSTPQFPYPAVVVVAADPPADFTAVTSSNHGGFVEAIAAAVGKATIRAPAKAKAGAHLAAAWAATGEADLDGALKKIERDCTAVIIAGRLYTVEAWAPRGKLTDAARAAARAVAAALAVPSLDPAASLAPEEPAGGEAPAEGEPRAEEPGPPEPGSAGTGSALAQRPA